MTKEQAHECYLSLADLQARLESGGKTKSETAQLEAEKLGLRNMLEAAGYDPDNEPEELWPENRTTLPKSVAVPGYEIYAYDKDDDRLDKLLDLRGHTVYNDAMPRAILAQLAALVKSEQLVAPDGQPYDWLELHKDKRRIAVA